MFFTPHANLLQLSALLCVPWLPKQLINMILIDLHQKSKVLHPQIHLKTMKKQSNGKFCRLVKTSSHTHTQIGNFGKNFMRKWQKTVDKIFEFVCVCEF